jgi:hypothetical protein
MALTGQMQSAIASLGPNLGEAKWAVKQVQRRLKPHDPQPLRKAVQTMLEELDRLEDMAIGLDSRYAR